MKWELTFIDGKPHRRVAFSMLEKNICIVNKLTSFWYIVWVDDEATLCHETEVWSWILSKFTEKEIEGWISQATKSTNTVMEQLRSLEVMDML